MTDSDAQGKLDGQNNVWTVADGIKLPVRRLIASNDGGKSFSCCKVYNKMDRLKIEGNVKVFSNRVDSELFYGFGGNRTILSAMRAVRR